MYAVGLPLKTAADNRQKPQTKTKAEDPLHAMSELAQAFCTEREGHMLGQLVKSGVLCLAGPSDPVTVATEKNHGNRE
jgi:hypothetical protein